MCRWSCSASLGSCGSWTSGPTAYSSRLTPTCCSSSRFQLSGNKASLGMGWGECRGLSGQWIPTYGRLQAASGGGGCRRRQGVALLATNDSRSTQWLRRCCHATLPRRRAAALAHQAAEGGCQRRGGGGGGGARVRRAHRGQHERAGEAERREAQHSHAGEGEGLAWPAWCLEWPSPASCLTPLPPPQIYDYIDRHITKLDKDCKAFDAGTGRRLPLPSRPRVPLLTRAAAGRQPLSTFLPALPLAPSPSVAPAAEIAKERQRLGMPPVEPTIGGASSGVDSGKRKRKDGEQRKLTPEEQYQVCGRGAAAGWWWQGGGARVLAGTCAAGPCCPSTHPPAACAPADPPACLAASAGHGGPQRAQVLPLPAHLVRGDDCLREPGWVRAWPPGCLAVPCVCRWRQQAAARRSSHTRLPRLSACRLPLRVVPL